jgi:hypothetical protein
MNGYNILILLKNKVVEFGKAEMILRRFGYISSNGQMAGLRWLEWVQTRQVRGSAPIGLLLLVPALQPFSLTVCKRALRQILFIGETPAFLQRRGSTTSTLATFVIKLNLISRQK